MNSLLLCHPGFLAVLLVYMGRCGYSFHHWRISARWWYASNLSQWVKHVHTVVVAVNTYCVIVSSIYEFNYAVRINPRSSVLQHFKCRNLADTLDRFSDRSHWASFFNPVLASAHWCLQLIICIASWAVEKGVPCKRKSTCLCKPAACGSAVFTLEWLPLGMLSSVTKLNIVLCYVISHSSNSGWLHEDQQITELGGGCLHKNKCLSGTVQSTSMG